MVPNAFRSIASRGAYKAFVAVAVVALAACTHDFGVFTTGADDAAISDARGGGDGSADGGAAIDGAAIDGAADGARVDGASADASDGATCKPSGARCMTTAQCCANLSCQDSNGTQRCN